MSRIDIILMGSRSYKQILAFGEWGWPDKQTYVFTSQQLEIDKPYISITHDSPLEFMASSERKSDKDICFWAVQSLLKSFAQKA
jgi:hypothetical protein